MDTTIFDLCRRKTRLRSQSFYDAARDVAEAYREFAVREMETLRAKYYETLSETDFARYDVAFRFWQWARGIAIDRRAVQFLDALTSDEE